jgi:hypothetical protein
VFAGLETGTCTVGETAPVPLEIRMSRYFGYENGRWRQYHHHGQHRRPSRPARLPVDQVRWVMTGASTPPVVSRCRAKITLVIRPARISAGFAVAAVGASVRA